jgi:hypothetical protein
MRSPAHGCRGVAMHSLTRDSKLDLFVRLPSRRAMRLHRLGEMLAGSPEPAPRQRAGRSRPTGAPRKRGVGTA